MRELHEAITSKVARLLNSRLDGLVRTEVHVGKRSWPAFQACGYTGLVLAIGLAMVLVLYRGLSPWVMAGIIVLAIATFFTLAMLTKIVTGDEELTYYHHEIAVLSVTATALWLMRQPILPYLDATLLGIGMFLACGRIGCLMVGCCHGVPYRWGVRYRTEHAAAGLSSHYIGARLFPIQAIESLWVACVVVAGSALVFGGWPAGTALAWYIVSYDIGRFWFEFMRGDLTRHYFGGFSEAQWTSLALMVLLALAEARGLLPFHAWHIVATAALIAAMAIIAGRRRMRQRNYELLHPRHVHEIASALDLLNLLVSEWHSQSPSAAEVIHLATTSLGLQMTLTRTGRPGGWSYHYGLSLQGGQLDQKERRALPNVILYLKHPECTGNLVGGSNGVLHLLIQQGA